MNSERRRSAPLRGVLLDLGGVVYVGDRPIEGAIQAIERLRAAGLPLRFITNTTRRPRRAVRDDLRRMGLVLGDDELLTPAQMARAYLAARGLSPSLLIHPDLAEDFAGLPATGPEAVVIGDAGCSFTYARLNDAYRKINGGAPLLALAMNRNFKDDDGELSLDAGPFVTALEYASRRQAVLLGKPSQTFFALALEGLGCPAGEAAMVGDDAEADIGGALASGIGGVLVRTGKYRSGDEATLAQPPDHVADDLAAAVDWILDRRDDP